MVRDAVTAVEALEPFGLIGNFAWNHAQKFQWQGTSVFIPVGAFCRDIQAFSFPNGPFLFIEANGHYPFDVDVHSYGEEEVAISKAEFPVWGGFLPGFP